MPRGSWSAKRERQYKHVYASCLLREKCPDLCKIIAGATVNKTRAVKGEARTVGRHCPRGTVPLKSSKTTCYDRRKHRRVRRITP